MNARRCLVVVGICCMVAGAGFAQAPPQEKLDNMNRVPAPWPTRSDETLGGGSDTCATAPLVTGVCGGVFFFDNANATTDGQPDPLCDAFGTQQIDNDVWFCWQAPPGTAGGVQFETCGGTTVDTKIAMYGPFPDCATATATGCPGGNIQACNDDTCGLQSLIAGPGANSGEIYLVRIGTFPGATGGTGDVLATCTVPVGLDSVSLED